MTKTNDWVFVDTKAPCHVPPKSIGMGLTAESATSKVKKWFKIYEINVDPLSPQKGNYRGSRCPLPWIHSKIPRVGTSYMPWRLALLGSSKNLHLLTLSWTESNHRMKDGEPLTGMNSSLIKGDGKSTYHKERLPRRSGYPQKGPKRTNWPWEIGIRMKSWTYFHPSSTLS